MDKVTVEQTQKAIEEHKITWWAMRDCSICGAPLSYSFENGVVLFNSNCCCVTYRTEPRQMSIEQFIDETFNLQSDPEAKKRMWDDFITYG